MRRAEVSATASRAARSVLSASLPWPATTRAASNATALTTVVAYRLNSSCTATSSSAKKTVTPPMAPTTPAPRSRGLVPDLLDVGLGVRLDVAPDRLEADPHQGAEARHDQHCDCRA